MSEAVKRYSPAGRIMETLASLATRKPLRKMQAFGEGRERLSVRQLDAMLHDAGNDLADYSFTLRKDFDAIVAERDAALAELAAIRAQSPVVRVKVWNPGGSGEFREYISETVLPDGAELYTAPPPQPSTAALCEALASAHAFIENTEAFGHSAASGVLECGGAVWNIDESKKALAEHREGKA